MQRNSADEKLFPAYYNHLLLNWQRRQLDLSIRAVARLIRIREDTVRAVFHGLASSKKVYPVAQQLGLDWAKVHDLNLAEEDYPSAILNGSLQGSHLIAPQEAVSNST